MRLYVSGATATLRRLAPTAGDVLGCLPVPAAGNAPPAIAALGLPIAIDNGAFTGFKPGPFAKMLADYDAAGVRVDWVACPDVVADADGTYALWTKWSPIIRGFGFRPALVLQDGMDREAVRDFDPPAVFVGGSTGWKLGPQARLIVEMVAARGRPCHMGRVNTRRRIRYAAEIGCTSCDGSGFSQWPDARIPKGVRWVRAATAKTLFTQTPAAS